MPPQTKIKSIRIKNVKGIAEKTFVFQTPEMIGNKFHVLVAPNGFGKSSFAAAFRSLKPQSLKLSRGDFHARSEVLVPELELVISEDGNERSLVANPDQNDLHREFSISVVNSRLKPKAIERPYIAHARPTAELTVEPVVLVARIPARPVDIPSQTELKERFGANGKILPSFALFLENPVLLLSILQASELRKFTQQRVWNQLDPILAAINAEQGSAVAIKEWIEANQLGALREIEPIAEVAGLFSDYNDFSDVDRFMVAIVFGQLHHHDASFLKRIRAWRHYLAAHSRQVKPQHAD